MERTTTTTTTTITFTQRAPRRRGKHTPYVRKEVDFAKVDMEGLVCDVLGFRDPNFKPGKPAYLPGEKVLSSPERVAEWVAAQAKRIRSDLLVAANMMKLGIDCEDTEDDYKCYWAWVGKAQVFQRTMTPEQRRRFNAEYEKPKKMCKLPAPHYPFKARCKGQK
jgi:hypothetical protein